MSYYNVSLTPSFEILPTGRYNVTLLFSVANIADHDCWAYRHSLLQMKDLFRESFKITNENGEKASYSGRLVKLLPTLMLIKANEALSKEFILTNSYDFPGGNEIRITYSDRISCCPESQEIHCDSEVIEASATLLVGISLSPQEQIYYASYNEF
jgi:hypothetical protein